MKIKLILIIVISTKFAFSQISNSGYVVDPCFEKGSTCLSLQPNGPFAVMFFNQSALGAYCGVIYYQRLDDSKDTGPWQFNDRFWQEEKWASDVNNIAWSPSGKYLYIATSSVYGEGGIFWLDLLKRKFKSVFPTGKESFYQSWKGFVNRTIIDSIDFTSSSLIFHAIIDSTVSHPNEPDSLFTKILKIKID